MDRDALESAAAKYSYLRGLLFIPGGLIFIVAALGNWEVGPFANAWMFVATLAALGVCALLVTRYYNDNYGRLTASPRQQVRAGVAAVVAIAVMIIGSLLLRSRAEWSLDLPVNAIAVSFAVVMLISYAVGVGLRAHHVSIWGALLVAGALPVWNGDDPSNVALVMCGVAVVVCGVFDHRLFVRTFGPPSLPAHAGA
jgi:hypothetical protein